MSVILREKTLKEGGVSFYLEINQDKKRRYKFLNIYAYGNRRSDEFKEKLELAKQARDSFQYELSVKKHNLVNENGKNKDFIAFLLERTSHLRSKNSYIHLKNWLIKYSGSEYLPMGDITKEFLLGFTEHLQKNRLNTNSIYGMVHRFSTYITRAVEMGYMDFNPFHKIPKGMRAKLRRPSPRYLVMDQVKELNKHSGFVHPQIRQAFFLSCFCGLRWGNVSRLKWEDIFVQTIDKKEVRVVQVMQIKTDFYVNIPLSEAAISILKQREEDAAKELPSIYVFPYLYEPHDKKIRYSSVAQVMRKWGEKAKIKVTFHLSRHTFATEMLSAGNDLYTVSKLLGHTEIKNTQIYANVVDRKKIEAAKSFPKYNLAIPEKEEPKKKTKKEKPQKKTGKTRK